MYTLTIKDLNNLSSYSIIPNINQEYYIVGSAEVIGTGSKILVKELGLNDILISDSIINGPITDSGLFDFCKILTISGLTKELLIEFKACTVISLYINDDDNIIRDIELLPSDIAAGSRDSDIAIASRTITLTDLIQERVGSGSEEQEVPIWIYIR